MASTPSLAQSDDSAVYSSSAPPTPALSPFMNAGVYSLPPVDSMALPYRNETPHISAYTILPDIMDPATAVNVPIRHLCCIGAGYVGGPTAAVLALHNPSVRVTVIDRDEARIRAWKSRHLPIHEPGLPDVVRLARDGADASAIGHGGRPQGNVSEHGQDSDNRRVIRRPNLFFSTACADVISTADMVLISVNTPTKKRGLGAGRATDMTALEGAIRDIARYAKPGTILVEKSTVPCKTGQLIKDTLEAHRPGVGFPVLSNPEFLSEGTAIRDLMQPDRIILGCESTISGHRAAAALVNLYSAWVPRSRIAPINIWSSELCKLVANAMLAQRISSINSISAICERTGADVNEISKSIGMDARIGSQFLKAGLGFGGSCFRKDIASLTYLAESLGLPEVAAYWQQVLTINEFQRDRFARGIISSLNNTLRGKKITVFGYAFKKNTGDARESPALDVIRILLEDNPASISIFDPLCSAADIENELSALGERDSISKPQGPIEIHSDPYAASAESSAILVLTDWDMFKNGKPATLSKPATKEGPFYSAAAPATILGIPQQSQDNTSPPTPPRTPKISYLLSDFETSLAPEPSCAAECPECYRATQSRSVGSRDISTPLDWPRIAVSVKQPRWVFDGRGILDVGAMAGMGFRLETLGKASMY